MKKKIILFIAIIIVVLFQFNGYKKDEISSKISTMSIDSKIEEFMKYMTIEEKVAQMLIVYYPSSIVDSSLKETLSKTTYGGFILSSKNITTYVRTKKFIYDIKLNSKIPPIISIDEEGGLVQRLKYLQDLKVTDIPNMYKVGTTKDLDYANDIGKVVSEELRTLGINVDYAPVLDIHSNNKNKVIGKRSFGKTPEIVSNMGISFARGLENNGIIAVYKHFPGHGNTATDSHVTLPVINKTYRELKEFELIPFKRAIENGAKMIMIGHIALPKVTGNKVPATLSKTIINDILKKDMGYDGLVITDALNMGALTKNYSEEEIYKKAIEAGNDILLMPQNPQKAIAYISRNFNEERINKSVKKILKFKYDNFRNYKYLDKSYLGSEEHKNIVSHFK